VGKMCPHTPTSVSVQIYVSSYSYICVRTGALSYIHPLLVTGADINVRPSCLKNGQDGDSEDEDERWNVCVEGGIFILNPNPASVSV
jgi:hypothetical protein